MIQDKTELGRLNHEVAHADLLHEDIVIDDIASAEAAGDITEAQANKLMADLLLRLHETRQSFFSSLNELQET